MNKTSIEWVKNPDYTGIPKRDAKGRFQYQGYTWNPITGCLNGCEYCYARNLANGRLLRRYLANDNTAPLDPRFSNPSKLYPDFHKGNPFYPRFWEDRLGLPIEYPTPMRPAKRKGIFVCDMSDLFGIGIPQEWTEQVMTTIKLCPYHRFYLLTKQPQNLIKFSPFPDNCWVGTSVTHQTMFRSTLINFHKIEAKVKYISFEPLLGEIEFNPINAQLFRQVINGVIIGSQTKPYKPPLKIWVDEIIEDCKKASIPYFLKDNLRPLLGDNLVQDMPSV